MATGPDPTRGLTVPEAADRLGITAEAVRQRIKRSTLRHEKREGTVYVFLDDDPTRPTGDRPTDRTSDEDALVSTLRGQVEQLQRQLDVANQRDLENRRLLAAALERIPPQLEAPQGAGTDRSPEAPVRTPPDASDEPSGASPGTQTATARPWWRRLWER